MFCPISMNAGISGFFGPSVREITAPRCVTGVPVELMPRVQYEAEIAGLIGPDQRRTIHYARDLFETLRDLDVVHGRINLWKRTQHAIRFKTCLKRRESLWIESLGLRHAARHPKQDESIGGRRELRAILSRKLTRRRASKGRERNRGRHIQ